MKAVAGVVVLALVFGGCASTGGHALAFNSGVHHVQSSRMVVVSGGSGTVRSLASAREWDERDWVRPEGGSRGIPTPQPAREPFFIPTPQPPIPSPPDPRWTSR